ncbi:hypothetical protein P5673_027639 [Acropora cervicornis]|uniref:Uncharacterized protein n=1 Tax=Acropora cervicornis TaxID=6130 RepID=A0AAD9PYY4_ACRCE|nr:hypothetical protein P5673_027639 [Acropora cervicornis]
MTMPPLSCWDFKLNKSGDGKEAPPAAAAAPPAAGAAPPAPGAPAAWIKLSRLCPSRALANRPGQNGSTFTWAALISFSIFSAY